MPDELKTCIICGKRFPQSRMECSNGAGIWVCKNPACLTAYISQTKEREEATHENHLGTGEPQILTPETPPDIPPQEAEGAD